MNLYEYCWNDPVNWRDPYGLQGIAIGLGIGSDVLIGRRIPGFTNNDLRGPGIVPRINIDILTGLMNPPTTGLGSPGSFVPGGNALPGPKVKSIDEGLNQGMEYDKPGEVGKGGEGEKGKEKDGEESDSEAWKKGKTKEQPAKGKYKGGISKETEYINIKTGNKKWLHQIIDKNGRIRHEHLRPYPKQ